MAADFGGKGAFRKGATTQQAGLSASKMKNAEFIFAILLRPQDEPAHPAKVKQTTARRARFFSGLPTGPLAA
jgi:hypothetical protein